MSLIDRFLFYFPWYYRKMSTVGRCCSGMVQMGVRQLSLHLLEVQHKSVYVCEREKGIKEGG